MSSNGIEVEPLVLYGIGGLGADQRVFQYLELDCEILPIVWIMPKAKEPLSNYAQRISSQIDIHKRFGLIGVSFGGMLAMELNKLVAPEFTILISSASKYTELPSLRHHIRRIRILDIAPKFLLKPPFFVMKYLFSAKNSELLKEITDDTDTNFIKWALNQIISWDFSEEIENVYSIQGSNDRLIPLKNSASIEVDDGGHFMVVDQAKKVSHIVNDILRRHLV